MLKIVKRAFPLKEEGRINQMTAELAQEHQRRVELEDAIVELGELFAEQDDAIVELASLIEEV